MHDRVTAPTLANLILQRKGGRSFDRLAEDCGGAPAGRRLQQMANGKPMRNFPDPETVTALARGLGVPAKDIIMASARSLGITVDAADPGDLVIPDARALPESAQLALMGMARELLAAYRA